MMGSRGLCALLVCTACTGDEDPFAARTYSFGPITIGATEEDTSKCVQISLHNKEPLLVNQVELVTGPGFHHSNWLFVPEHVFAGDDGVFTCDDRNFDQAAAGILGGVFFAQSTQAAREVQQFPPGTAIRVPANSKLVSTIHLLNTSDEPVTIEPTMAITPLPPAEVTKTLASVTFEYHTLGLPPRKQSRFTVECEIAPRHVEAFGRAPDFKIFYALAHYHEWGTRLAIEAIRDDGTSTAIFTTANAVGDALGGMIDPAFDFTGFSKLRLTCDYYNNTDATIYYGNGKGEMCIFNAFSDSPYAWAGGALDTGDPGTPTEINGVMSFSRGCQVYAIDASR